MALLALDRVTLHEGTSFDSWDSCTVRRWYPRPKCAQTSALKILSKIGYAFLIHICMFVCMYIIQTLANADTQTRWHVSHHLHAYFVRIWSRIRFPYPSGEATVKHLISIPTGRESEPACFLSVPWSTHESRREDGRSAQTLQSRRRWPTLKQHRWTPNPPTTSLKPSRRPERATLRKVGK